MEGGTGNNFLRYNDSPGSVNVDLALGTATGAAGADTFSSIGNIFGSPSPDTLAGDAQANFLSGGDGDDVLEGAAGDDTLRGGPDPGDRVVYDEAPIGVSVDLSTAAPQATLGDGTDTIGGVERVTGSSLHDTFRGSAGANGFDGGPGDDLVTYVASATPVNVDLGAGTATGQGADTLTSISWAFGSPMNDTLLGDGGPNILNGLGGDDAITGAGGSDDLVGSDGADSIFARDGVADTVNCGTEADSAELDADTVDASVIAMRDAPSPGRDSGTTRSTKPKCKKGRKLKKVKGKFKCVKKKKGKK